MRSLKSGFLAAFLVCFLTQPLYAAGTHNLVSSKVDSAPKIDGSGNDAQWKSAKKTTAEAEDGPEMSIQSVYTNDSIFFLVQWEDLTGSVDMDRWIYDGSKWSIKQEERVEETRDADTDRLGFQWPITDPNQIKKEIKGKVVSFAEVGCSVLCHSPEKEDKMYLPEAGQQTDLWQWKAALTNPMGYADDWHQDSTNKTAKEEPDKNKRRSAAQKGDEPLAYTRNIDGDKPKWMPEKGQDNRFLIKGHEVPLDMSRIKKGDSVPGWLLSKPKGSGGDITAKGKYEEEEMLWTVEISRKLVTSDKKNDVQFDITKQYHFGMANWENDRYQAHTRVKKPFLLSFK